MSAGAGRRSSRDARERGALGVVMRAPPLVESATNVHFKKRAVEIKERSMEFLETSVGFHERAVSKKERTVWFWNGPCRTCSGPRRTCYVPFIFRKPDVAVGYDARSISSIGLARLQSARAGLRGVRLPRGDGVSAAARDEFLDPRAWAASSRHEARLARPGLIRVMVLQSKKGRGLDLPGSTFFVRSAGRIACLGRRPCETVPAGRGHRE
jgi:hypothetical protein